jgi:hypothetical protein
MAVSDCGTNPDGSDGVTADADGESDGRTAGDLASAG